MAVGVSNDVPKKVNVQLWGFVTRSPTAARRSTYFSVHGMAQW